MFLQLVGIAMVVGLFGGIVWRVVEGFFERRAWAKKVALEQEQELYYKHDCQIDDE
jgi:hypothetical protein